MKNIEIKTTALITCLNEKFHPLAFVQKENRDDDILMFHTKGFEDEFFNSPVLNFKEKYFTLIKQSVLEIFCTEDITFNNTGSTFWITT